MIVVIDHGRGNIFSLQQALRHLGADCQVSSDPSDVVRAERLILPGVGAFADTMRGLMSRGLDTAVKEAVARNVSLLGICVGCQVLLEEGREFGTHAGLGLIPGVVDRLPAPRPGDAAAIRIPNVGWRSITIVPSTPVLGALAASPSVYFVHSFAPRPTRAEHIGATLEVNGQIIAVGVRRGNIFGVQFHPEKSGPAGLGMLEAFIRFEPSQT